MLDQKQLPSFECAEFKVSSMNESVACVVIYTGHPTHKDITCSVFFEELENYVGLLLAGHADFFILGDFNIHMNKVTDRDAVHFRDILSSYDLVQHVNSATHKSGNTLDLIITTATSKYNLSPVEIDYYFSDHAFISTSISINRAKKIRKAISSRNLRDIFQ